MPYHLHLAPGCGEEPQGQGHSGLLAVLLDGRGLYGAMEIDHKRPDDLDACGGHVGRVPAQTLPNGRIIPEETVYHYHASDSAPCVA